MQHIYLKKEILLKLKKRMRRTKRSGKSRMIMIHNFDEKLTLRARLLDMVIGDWDRHEDNWRWLPEKSKGETIYKPIPRDRDKVFYKTSGLLPWFLSHQWLKSNLQPYSENIRDVKGYNFNARYLDRYFLNQLDEDDWKEEIKYIQERLTSELIDSTMKFLPDSVYADPSYGGTYKILKRPGEKSAGLCTRIFSIFSRYCRNTSCQIKRNILIFAIPKKEILI